MNEDIQTIYGDFNDVYHALPTLAPVSVFPSS